MVKFHLRVFKMEKRERDIEQINLTMQEIEQVEKKLKQENNNLKVKRLNAFAKLPVRGSEFAAGYDLSSCEDAVVPARGKQIVKTGIAIAIPIGTYARIAPRSGLAAKNSIDVGAGVCDFDFRGKLLIA